MAVACKHLNGAPAPTRRGPRTSGPLPTFADRRTAPIAMAVAALLFGVSGCEDHFTNAGNDIGDVGPDVQPQFYGLGVGNKCSEAEVCRAGLACQGGACKPAANGPANDPCLLSEECAAGLQCGFFGFCVASAGRKENEPCTSVSDCERGLYCDLKGISGFCSKPATVLADLGAPCKKVGECFPGLHCSKVQGTCQPGSLPLSTDLFSGVACPDLEEQSLPFQARNAVPRQGSSLDFYSTPFPNDAWRDAAGKLNISKHPRSGPGLIGLDVGGAVIDGLNAEMDGFSTAPTLYVRFTRELDPASLVPSGPQQNVFLVDLDAGVINGGELHPLTWKFQPKRNKYICANWLALHPLWSRTLTSKHTYGLVIMDTARAKLAVGQDPKTAVPVQGDDLVALLGDAKPADATVAAVWDKQAKLRKWLDAKKLARGKVIAATSFTTADPTRVLANFRAAVMAVKDPPTIVGTPFVCGGANKGKKSPCIDLAFAAQKPGKPDPRDCPANADNASFTEIHFKIKMPVWQAGKRPYLEGGGGIALSGTNAPQLQGTEDVCAAIAIPKGKAMPAGGWPLLIFGHGTGGSLRSGPSDMGDALAKLTDGGAPLAVALLSTDQPMHGDRRGLPLDPGPLFYNFANPPAAKGNVYQGAADNFALVRFAKGPLNGATLSSVGKFQVNGNKIAYMGHSQGGTTGPMWLPFAHDGKGNKDTLGAVFSGTGGSLVYSLLNKKSPEDATVGIKLAMQEGDLDEWHPMLALMQHYFDESDPLSVAHLYYKKPLGPPQHVLHTFGQGDTYTPPQTSRVFAAATGGLMLKPSDAGPWYDPAGDLSMVQADHKADVSGNLTIGAVKVTGVTVQHLNDKAQSTNGAAYDGHFVAFKDKVCSAQVARFLATMFNGKVPVVPAQ